MKRMCLPYFKKITFLTFFFLSSTNVLLAQNSDPALSLSEEYSLMMDKAETYEHYKVIPIAKLNRLWGLVSDTIQQHQREIKRLNIRQQQLQASIDSLRQTIQGLETSLAESEAVNAEISFLGIPFSKTVYNVLVWGVVGILAIILIGLYVAFKNSHVVTKRAKRDFEQVNSEFETYRQKSHDKQVRLKRELQTALNSLEEYKNKIPSRTT